MADNVTVDNGALTDYTVSSDEATSGQVQRVKIAYSADGSDTHVTADSSGLLVNIGSHKDAVSDPMANTDQAVAVKAAIFGYSTAGSGSWEVVKVNPSGALTVEVNDGGSTISVDDGGSSLTVDGTVSVNPISSSSSTVTSVADSTSSVTLLSSNANRKGFAVWNAAEDNLYIKFGSTASTTSYTIRLNSNDYYEIFGHGIYTGVVDGIWLTDTGGSAKVTEW